MARYYFDLCDEHGAALDEEGLELSNMRAVQAEAAKSVGDMAREAIASAPATGSPQRMAIEVRDAGGPVLQVKFCFEIDSLTTRSHARDH